MRNTTASLTRKYARAAVAVPAVALLTLAAACSSDDASDEGATTAPETSETTSETTTSETTDAAASSALDTGNINIEVAPVDNLADGDVLSGTITGLNTEVAGYYLAICAAENANPVPDCTGDRNADPANQLWITKKDGGTTELSDRVEFEISASSTGDAVNCTEQDCVLKLFGDHAEGFEDVVDVPVTFAR